MTTIFRVLVLAALVLTPVASAGQATTVLRIRVVLADAAGQPILVPACRLLVSDNPPTAAPRLVVTGLDGTAGLKLRPGRYTVESDRPVTVGGKAYQWIQNVAVVAGREAVLELTAANAEIEESGPATTTTSTEPSDSDVAVLLSRWQSSVVALWTPTAHASGFAVSANGLILTNQRVLGDAATAQVQITPTVKVAARVVAVDRERDVAVLWMNPARAAQLSPVSLSCPLATPSFARGDEIFTVTAPLADAKGMTSGKILQANAGGITSDFLLPAGSEGGPVFTRDGSLVGITSLPDDHQSLDADRRIVPIDQVCPVLAAAEKLTKDAAPPTGAALPVEPAQPFPAEALQAAARSGPGNLEPYQIASSIFDITFITPVLTYAARAPASQGPARTTSRDTREPGGEPALVRPLIDFANWSGYVESVPPVLMVRVTPRLVEGFWTKVARGAARTQGVAIPPIKRLSAGFERLQAFCGDDEVIPIHPFELEHRLPNGETITEGLYVFDPAALGPDCGSVKLVLYSVKEPGKGNALVVKPEVVERFWRDFAPYRAQIGR